MGHPKLGQMGGDFTPFVKYNAKEGSWSAKFDGVEGFQLISHPRFAVDLANMKTGWLYFPPNGAPSQVWDPEDGEAAAPSSNHKRGFSLTIVGNQVIAEGPAKGHSLGRREWRSNAGATGGAVNDMYDAYVAGKDQNPGKMPIFNCTGVKPFKTQHGTNYIPLFTLDGWVDRDKVFVPIEVEVPAELPDDDIPF